MKDRTMLRLGIIIVLALIALYINFDFFRSDFQASPALTSWLSWQGEPAMRKLTLREGLDLKGGLRVLLQAQQGFQPTQQDMQDDKTVIQKRVDALGVSEPVVLNQGNDKIVVELPGVKDPELAVRTVGRTALLEYVNAGKTPLTEGAEVQTSYGKGDEKGLWANLDKGKQEPFQGTPAAPTAVSPSATVTGATKAQAKPTSAVTATGATTKTVTVYPTILTGKNIKNPAATIDPTTNKWDVSFGTDGQGTQWLGDFTAAHVGQYMPILLDKKVISSPVLKSKISDRGRITGNFDKDSAEALVVQLRSGSLPVPLDVVGQTQIGPTLGASAISAAIKGGILGLLVVMVFMLLYYRLPGLVADGALILYALFTLTIFRILPVTLTLAGIAGFVLSIGMAVDANILIFERMKEELRSGRRVRAAMDTGFARAWPSIRDSNISTLITCAILLWFGSQFGATIVQGFALTLAVGVLISMFTAIFVTRTFLSVVNRLVFHDTTANVMETPRLRALFGF
jgi:preprotein translocase subunit SecD